MYDDVVDETGEKLAKFVDFLTFGCQQLNSVSQHLLFSFCYICFKSQRTRCLMV